MRSTILPLLLLVGSAPAALAQQVNPATNTQSQAQPQEEEPGLLDRQHSWELPPTVVRAEGQLFEEDRIGEYQQPRWTAKRLFPTTRVYVVPSGKFEFEHWTRVKVPDEGKTTVENQYEIEIGLPGRFQLDLYYVTEKEGSEGELDLSEQKYELRYALADWGEIWMNPTLYVEYVERSEDADVIEYKVLLGDEIAPGWHFGSNLVLEAETGDEREREWELTAGISHPLVDSKFALGAEMKAALVDTKEDRGDFEKELEIGPSLRWQPIPSMHVDFAPLIGIGADSRAADIFLVVGWEF